MNKLMSFIKMTIVGGLLFLMPVIVIVVLITKAVVFLRYVVRPLAEQLPISKVAGMGVISLLSVLLLLIICFLAGLLVRTPFARRIKRVLEENVLIYIPGYSYLKALSSGALENNSQDKWKPATVVIDDNEVICFVIDETENYCSIFLPAAPIPSSGSVVVREKSLVRYLPITVSQANALIRKFGRGAALIIEKIRPENLK